MRRTLRESKIALAILSNLAKRDIPCLPVHDSFLVPQWAAGEAETVIRLEFEAETGIQARVKVDASLLPDDLTPQSVNRNQYQTFFRWLDAHEAKHGPIRQRE